MECSVAMVEVGVRVGSGVAVKVGTGDGVRVEVGAGVEEAVGKGWKGVDVTVRVAVEVNEGITCVGVAMGWRI